MGVSTGHDFDVVVIGAGPAGSSCAFGLAQRGFRVAVIEARAFPRAKVCGEYISPAATALLETMLSAADLHRAGARREGTLVLEVGGREVRWTMPRPAWTLSRATLDDLLLRRAVEAGATAIQPAAVRGAAYFDDRAEVTLNDGRTMSAGIVVHADGSGRFDPSGAIAHRAGFVGHKRHLKGVALDGLRMRAAPGAYIGTVMVEGGRATCALVARARLAKRFAGDLDAMLVSLWPQYRPEWGDGPWMSCPVPGAPYTAPGHARSFRIGNAAAGVEPVGGEGIGLALWSGLTLAGMLDADDPVGVQRAFGRVYRRRLLRRRWGSRLAAAALERPGLIGPLAPILAAPRWSLAPWWAVTGKPL